MAWYYKANFKTNPPKLEIKKEELCPYFFKYINCKGEYQADNDICPFWRHWFNKKWHLKKYQELYENRGKSIHSVVGEKSIWFERT